MVNTEIALKEVMMIEGALGTALVDVNSGLALGTLGGGAEFDLDAAAAGNTDVLRAKYRTMKMLGISGTIEDILITLSSQYHLIRPLGSRGGSGLFLYLVLDRKRANLAMARRQLAQVEGRLEV